jgi:alkylhydroperoxidase/carboxymuconolactone decarboxylase family protein YurZ
LTGWVTGTGPPAPTERIVIMNMPTRASVGDQTRDTLTGLAMNDHELLLEGLEMRAEWQQKSGLDPRTFSLVKIAALIALDAPPSSYLWQVGTALDAGCTPDDLLGVLKAIAPQVGGPKVVAAAPELMIALGLELPEDA